MELFYKLKGGRVDYGIEHATRCGHDRFGATSGLLCPHSLVLELPVFDQGLYPRWSDRNPVHLLVTRLEYATVLIDSELTRALRPCAPTVGRQVLPWFACRLLHHFH